jgi:pimeloyl-ACP methyl ester carboxylesterase
MSALERDGISLVYHEMGSGDPPMIFVHGWCCDHTYFVPQAEHFSQHHRVVSVDLRGHGESDKPEQEYPIEGYADDVGWLCDQLELRQVVAVGHSMGGQIVLALAAQRPELVAAIVMIDSPVFLTDSLADNMPGFIEGLRGPEYVAAARGFIEGALFLPDCDLDLRDRAVLEMTSAPQHVMVSSMENIIRDRSALATAVQCPALEIDAHHSLNNPEKLRAAMPSLEVEATPGLGHFNHLEGPDQVNSIIERFLARHGMA